VIRGPAFIKIFDKMAKLDLLNQLVTRIGVPRAAPV
jgi:hypothetical protein